MTHAEKAQYISRVTDSIAPVIERYRDASVDEIQHALAEAESPTEADVLQILRLIRSGDDV